MKNLILYTCAIITAIALWASLSAFAEAQGNDTPTANVPSDNMLSNPLNDPGGAIDDVSAARKYGWPIVALVILRGLLLVIGRWVPRLREGKRALLVAAAVTALGAGFDAAVAGGSLVAVAFAIAGSALWFAEAAYKPKPAKDGLVEAL